MINSMIELLGDIKKMVNDASNYKEVELNDEILNRWKTLGFLNGLDDNLSNKCALSFERLARYLLSGAVEKDDFVETCAFPCARRVIQAISDDIMPEEVVKKLSHFHHKNIHVDDLEGEYKISEEAKITAFAADSIVYDLIKSGRYKVVKV